MSASSSSDTHALYNFRFGSAEFDESRFELRVAGLAVEVQRKPLEVLSVLLHRAGEVVTREELLDEVWQGRITVDNVVGNALAKLRAALGEENATRIVTQSKVGYRLIGPIERTAVGRQMVSTLVLAAGQPVPRRDHFTLEALIGQSEGSEVWLAKHTKTGERRIYKFGRDGKQLAAFKREATLYRVLREGVDNHELFTRIIDWNFEQAPFFLECEYGGQDLSKWALSDNRLERMTLPERLVLFQQIVDAVAAAHSVGVLHKDLKPSNVLVAPRGEAWQARLTDFGSGRLLDPGRLAELGITRLGLTVTESVLGNTHSATPLYVAPEIIAGHSPTAQSDVYALGLMLYQVIVGDLRKPMASGWEREVANELLREDLAAATDGNPAHRLSSASELADRLRTLDRRSLERIGQQAVQAEARKIAESLQRSRTRRPLIIALFGALVVGLCFSLVSYWRATAARRSAEAAATQVQAMNRFLNQDLLRAADPTAPGNSRDPTMRQVLAMAARRIDSQLSKTPLTRAAIHETLGNAYAGLGDYANAEVQLRLAIGALPATGEPQGVRTHSEYDLAAILLNLSKFKEAKTLLDQADRDAGELLRRPTSLAVQAHLTRGILDDDEAQESEALSQFVRADQLRQIAMPDDVPMLFKIRIELGGALIAARRFAEARQAITPLLEQQFTIDRVGVENWARVRESYAEVLSEANDFLKAVQFDQEALAALRANLGEDHLYVAYAASELANVYEGAGKPAEALPLFREAYEISRKALGADSQNAILARGDMAIAEAQIGHIDEGIADLRVTLVKLTQIFGADNPQVMFGKFYLASCLSEKGAQAEAWSLISAIDLNALSNAGEGGQDWPERVQGLKGQILLRQRHVTEALALLGPAVAKMQADHMADWIVDPLRRSLDIAQRE